MGGATPLSWLSLPYGSLSFAGTLALVLALVPWPWPWPWPDPFYAKGLNDKMSNGSFSWGQGGSQGGLGTSRWECWGPVSSPNTGVLRLLGARG
jgi:hypothetical protein